MLTRYIRAAMHRARYEILPDDGTFYGEIPGFDGVYANAKTLEACRDELEEVLEEWMLLRVSKILPLPVVDGIELAIREVTYSGFRISVWQDRTRKRSPWHCLALTPPSPEGRGEIMPRFGPIRRRDLIRYLKQVGFEGPYASGKHQFMI